MTNLTTADATSNDATAYTESEWAELLTAIRSLTRVNYTNADGKKTVGYSLTAVQSALGLNVATPSDFAIYSADSVGLMLLHIEANRADVATNTAALAAVNSVLNGSGTPATSLGSNGDLYVNTADGTIYTKSSGVWAQIVTAASITQLATETTAGVIEIATDAEAIAQTATDKAIVPSNLAALGLITGVVDDTTPQLGGALDGQGFDVTGIGVLTMAEQAAAEADVAGRGQWWVQTATPNVAMFTDDAGTDFTLSQAAASQAEAEAGTEAALRSFSPQRVAQAILALASSGGIASVAIQAFTGSGTYTPTSGMTHCIAFATGGGGGGGGGDASSSSRCGGGGGGGAGGTGILVIDAATIGASQTVTIGAAGTAGADTGGAGAAGGATTLGALLTGSGGSGGGGGATSIGAGGAGGAASSGVLNVTGGAGGTGFVGNDAGTVAGGAMGGHGGGSLWGGGGSGSARDAGEVTSVAGNAGVAYGSGGGGASCNGTTTGAAGGAGAAGCVFVVEFVA